MTTTGELLAEIVLELKALRKAVDAVATELRINRTTAGRRRGISDDAI